MLNAGFTYSCHWSLAILFFSYPFLKKTQLSFLGVYRQRYYLYIITIVRYEILGREKKKHIYFESKNVNKIFTLHCIFKSLYFGKKLPQNGRIFISHRQKRRK